MRKGTKTALGIATVLSVISWYALVARHAIREILKGEQKPAPEPQD